MRSLAGADHSFTVAALTGAGNTRIKIAVHATEPSLSLPFNRGGGFVGQVQEDGGDAWKRHQLGAQGSD